MVLGDIASSANSSSTSISSGPAPSGTSLALEATRFHPMKWETSYLALSEADPISVEIAEGCDSASLNARNVTTIQTDEILIDSHWKIHIGPR